jgi:hypothetical protein
VWQLECARQTRPGGGGHSLPDSEAPGKAGAENSSGPLKRVLVEYRRARIRAVIKEASC